MGNDYFRFKQFEIKQAKCAMKVTTDACLFGAWVGSLAQQHSRVLDIGGGTGLLSLMVCQQHMLTVESVEIEASCYQQLVENIAHSPFRDSITPHLADIKTWKIDKLFDLVISNPPFYEKQLRSETHATNLARHDDGLNLPTLFEQVDRLLIKTGTFCLLMPAYRKAEAVQVADGKGFFAKIAVEVCQSAAHAPFRVMFAFSREKQETAHDRLQIRNGEGEFTSEFSALLKPFYL